MKPLLFELGVEELPPSYVRPAFKELKQKFEDFFKKNRIEYSGIKAFGTPRRIAILVENVAEKQEEWEKEMVGPPVRVAYDAAGNPTKAAISFAQSAGVDIKDLKIVTNKKGEYVAAVVKEGGASTVELLKSEVPEIVKSLKFKKTMRWADAFRFPRPIRWIVFIFGDDTVEIEIAGVKSGKVTRGQRLISPAEIEVQNPLEYEELMEKNFVIADFKKRREIVIGKINETAQKAGGKIIQDEELIDEVTNLVEYPEAVLGSFDEKYLELPDEVVITAMKQHQRYFSVVNSDGKLLPYFVAVINNRAEYEEFIRPGLERVLRARLEDAKFYYEEDLKESLDKRVEKLKGVVWREMNGRVVSMYEKVMRVKELALKLAEGDPEVDKKVIERGALLSKTDLTTEMIRDGKEFTKLEGKIGMEYAIALGEDERVAKVIFEHHLPRFSGDQLPTQKESAYVGLADRIDTIVGIFSAGYEVKGSQDPLGMRKLSYGLIDLILGLNVKLDLGEAIRTSMEIYGIEDETLLDRILNFIFTRFENYLEERLGIRYDIVDAVIASGIRDLVNLKNRAVVLNELLTREPEVFDKVVIGQKRVANILKNAGELPSINPELFEKEEERTLYETAKSVEPMVIKALQKEEFREALNQLLLLKDPIDKFFDNVFVMTENESVRENRLALLKFVREIFSHYGDLSKIVVEGQS